MLKPTVKSVVHLGGIYDEKCKLELVWRELLQLFQSEYSHVLYKENFVCAIFRSTNLQNLHTRVSGTTSNTLCNRSFMWCVCTVYSNVVREYFTCSSNKTYFHAVASMKIMVTPRDANGNLDLDRRLFLRRFQIEVFCLYIVVSNTESWCKLVIA